MAAGMFLKMLKKKKKAKALINQKRGAWIAAAILYEGIVYKAQRSKNKVHFIRQKTPVADPALLEDTPFIKTVGQRDTCITK